VSEELGRKDFGGIVWDEIIAFWIVLIFIMPTPIWMQAIAFGLFRFFDAVKPGPIGMIDRYFKNMGSNDGKVSSMLQIIWHGFGIMVDDLAAAFFTLLAIALIQKIIPL
jgi:phosphatidylglycerophosphatase A